MAHIVYALSPGGVEASVARTTRWRRAVERAVAGTRLDADDVEAMLFLESAGRPTVMADGTPASATGLMQIIPSTAVSLLGMRVDLARSLEINRALPRAQRQAVLAPKAKKRRAARQRVRRLLRERKVVDERFDPQKSLDGAVRYLLEARRRFGRDDLAIASYHMGIGNLRTPHRHVHLAAPPRPQHAADSRAQRPVMAAASTSTRPRPATRAPGTCSPISATTRATTCSRCSRRARSCGWRAEDRDELERQVELQTDEGEC